MLSRIKTAHRSFSFLKVAKFLGNFELQCVELTDLNNLIHNLNELYNSWLSQQQEKKLPSSSKKFKTTNFGLYKSTFMYNSLKGHPSYNLDLHQVASIKMLPFTMQDISNILGISRTTLWRRVKDSNLTFDNVSDEDLDKKVENIKVIYPLIGERMVIGMLRSQGTSVQRWKIRESIHIVDPFNSALRWLRSNPG